MNGTTTLRLSDELANSILDEGLEVTGLRNKADYLTQLIRKYGPQFNQEAKPFSTCCCSNQHPTGANRSKPKASNRKLHSQTESQPGKGITPELPTSNQSMNLESAVPPTTMTPESLGLPSMLEMLNDV